MKKDELVVDGGFMYYLYVYWSVVCFVNSNYSYKVNVCDACNEHIAGTTFALYVFVLDNVWGFVKKNDVDGDNEIIKCVLTVYGQWLEQY